MYPFYQLLYELWNTVNMERFAGLNICGFGLMNSKFFMGILSWSLSHHCLLFNYSYKYSRENYCGTLKNHKNPISLAQRIFPCLQYIGRRWHGLN